MPLNRRAMLGHARLITTIVATCALGLTAPALATPALAGSAPAGPVSAHAANGTPALPNSTKSVEQVRQLVQCGGTMYAVGTFTKIMHGNTTYTRDNAFSFSATSPYDVTSWSPDINGKVNSIAFSGSNCSDAYIGGEFSMINGAAAKNIAEVSTSTGQLVTGFDHSANGQVETVLGYNGHILTGGYFTSINGSSANAYFASLNATTGKDDGFLQLNISGSTGYATKVYNQQLSHNGTLELVEGDFTSVGGQPRQQIFMLNLAGSSATVTGWTSPQFDQPCASKHALYIEGASWSPDDSTVYVADTGYHPPGPKEAGGLCDAAAAFPATQTSVSDTWINYTGCWSLYSTAADSSAVYIGGHEEYANNPDGCKTAGPGAVRDPGLGGLNPANGNVLLNADGTAGLYSRSRGYGADDMLLTSAGLWVASDNFHHSNDCANSPDHAGICFLPYPS